jgi:uncharacterized ion transporter superfamily protein YfcC
MRKRKIPHTYVIVFYVIIISAILTWIVPGGEYSNSIQLVDGVEKEVLTYTEADNQP